MWEGSHTLSAPLGCPAGGCAGDGDAWQGLGRYHQALLLHKSLWEGIFHGKVGWSDAGVEGL